MSAWDCFDYEISYIDPTEMGKCWVRTDKEHIGEEVVNILEVKHGYRVKSRKYEKNS